MTHSLTPLSSGFVRRAWRPFFLTAILGAPAFALANHGDGWAQSFCSSTVSGSYLLSFNFSDGTFSSRGVLSLTRDGILIVNDSNQGGFKNKWDPFTSGQGAWRCAGWRAFNAVSINFNVPGEVDPDGGIARLDYTGQVDAEGLISGVVVLRFFELDQDPLHDIVTPADTFTFTGQRVEANSPTRVIP